MNVVQRSSLLILNVIARSKADGDELLKQNALQKEKNSKRLRRLICITKRP